MRIIHSTILCDRLANGIIEKRPTEEKRTIERQKGEDTAITQQYEMKIVGWKYYLTAAYLDIIDPQEEPLEVEDDPKSP